MKSILAIVLVFAVTGGGYYLFSKPFQANVKESVRQTTEWTEENIQRNPVGYLSWAIEQCEASERDLKARLLGLRTKKNQIDRGLSTSEASIADHKKLLSEAKTAYREGMEDGFPVKLRSVSIPQEQLKEKIVELDRRIGELDTNAQSYRKTLGVVESKLTQVDAHHKDVARLKSKLQADLEIARVNKSVSDITSVAGSIAGIRDTTNALSQENDDFRLELLLEQTDAGEVDEEFSKIMEDDTDG